MAKAATAVRQQEVGEDETGLSEEDKILQIQQQMQLFGSDLQTKFGRDVGLKEEIEQRWLDDLRHYNGRYDRETEANLNAADGTGKPKNNTSRVFVNLTRAKSNVAESKLSDLISPTDDRNWGIKATPVPELADALEDDSPLELQDGSVAVDPDNDDQAYTKADMARETMSEASKRAEAMEKEIDDQLTECNYNGVCREIIHNAVVMGTGIIKGPMVEKRTKRAWIENDDSDWVLDQKEENKPTACSVDPWNFFPDMSATKWEDVEYVFERHLLTRKDLRNLARQPGYMPEQVRIVLMSAPNAGSAKLNYLNELREISGITQIQADNRYEVLEYHGPVDKNNLIACGCEGIKEDDPLEEYEGSVWLCGGTVIKVALNHMDSDEHPYNVLNWEKDDTSPFGFGVPYRMRSPQKVMNASWRMVLDNAGLSTGPQILINKKMVSPADGQWTLSPRKVWWLNTNDPKVRADYAMQTFDIESNQPELVAIFELAKQLADEETSVPNINMGPSSETQQQPAMLKTLGGTALWMSSNNIMMRRAVKNFDDDVTVPFLTRFYDWNMQFNQKSEIKGDYSVDARGTSVLLVREMQARNMMEFINAALVLPEGPDEIKTRGVLKSMAKSMQLNVDDVMYTDDEKKTNDNDKAKEEQPMDPEIMKLQLQERIAMEESRRKLSELESNERIAQMNSEVEMTKLAVASEGKLKEIMAKADIEKYKTDVNIKQFYEELAIKKAEGETANYGLEATPG